MGRPLYDAKGNAVAYIADDGERTICLKTGEAVAYIDEQLDCYGWNGQCLGWVEDGVLFDAQGQAVGFMKPKRPNPSLPDPAGGSKVLKRAKGAKRPPCIRPDRRRGNSRLALEDFLKAGAVGLL